MWMNNWHDQGSLTQINIPSNHDMIVCLGFDIPLEKFSLVWRRHHYMYQWRASNFDLYSALMTIEQWGFFSVPHLLRHGASIYNGHLREPVTLTPIAERLAVELSLPVFTTLVCRGWDSNTQPSARGTNTLNDYATSAVYHDTKKKLKMHNSFYHTIKILNILANQLHCHTYLDEIKRYRKGGNIKEQ